MEGCLPTNGSPSGSLAQCCKRLLGCLSSLKQWETDPAARCGYDEPETESWFYRKACTYTSPVSVSKICCQLTREPRLVLGPDSLLEPKSLERIRPGSSQGRHISNPVYGKKAYSGLVGESLILTGEL
jgi:hypothetical protein